MSLSSLFCISANSRWTSLSEREKLALSPALMTPFLKNLVKGSDTGFLYLSTCHRVEIYGYGTDAHEIASAWCSATDASLNSLKIWRDTAALEHFTRVAAGLESEIIGENQIMAQVRTSLREAKDSALLSSQLGHILQRGLRISRNIRNESRIGEGRENLSDLAISSLQEVFESLTDKKFHIVGAGTMSLLALERLRKLKAPHITWINRSREKVEAHPYAQFAQVQDYANLCELVMDHDVVFLATSAQHPILEKLTLQKLKSKKRDQNLKVILDLGLPRNAHPDVCDLGFIVRNVDDFRPLLDDQDALQRERIDFADKILRRDLEEIKRDFELETINPLRREFLGKWKWLAEEIVLENSQNSVYNWDRFWAKLGHVLMTKANELGPYEGGQFLRHLCESLDSFDDKQIDGTLSSPRVLSLGRPSNDLDPSRSAQNTNPSPESKVIKQTTKSSS